MLGAARPATTVSPVGSTLTTSKVGLIRIAAGMDGVCAAALAAIGAEGAGTAVGRAESATAAGEGTGPGAFGLAQ